MSQELTPVLTQEAQPIQTSAMALAPMALAEQYLTELNLPIEQAAQAIELANQISLIPNDKSAASSLGKDCSSRMTAYADTILSQIKTIDEHGVQDRLSELVLNAKSSCSQ